jgi:hypothetical protein
MSPTTVVARSKAWTVIVHLNIGVVGSDLTRGIDVCVRLFCVCAVLCVGGGLATGCPPSKESYQLYIGLRNWKSGQGQTKGSVDEWINVYYIAWEFNVLVVYEKIDKFLLVYREKCGLL